MFFLDARTLAILALLSLSMVGPVSVHAVLDRHGPVKRRMGRRNRAKGTPLSLPGQPNDLWCADYKGEFMLADRRYCYPLTRRFIASGFDALQEVSKVGLEVRLVFLPLRRQCPSPHPCGSVFRPLASIRNR
jgi:hypothetical protein